MTGQHQSTGDSAIAELVESVRDGWSLPQAFYNSNSVYREECRRIWRHRWLFCGHSIEAANPGDYFVVEIDGDSLVVVRGDDRKLRALHNVCRHRGSRICLEAHGHVGKLVCPYHQWTYHRDGALAKAPLAPADFDREPFGLHAARCEEIAGLVFVSLADDPPDFEPARRAIEPQLEPHGLTRAKIAATRDYRVEANWKLIFENNRECYHCIVNHPQYSVANFAGSVLIEPGLQQELEAEMSRENHEWKARGIPVDCVDFAADRWFRAARSPLRKGCVSESIDGRAVSRLMGRFVEADMGSFRALTFPNFWLQASSDYAMTTRLLPAGAGVTLARVCWLVDRDAQENVDYQIDRLTEVWRETSEQDWTLSENNQRGIDSSRYEPGPLLAGVESGVVAFDRWYLDQMKD